MQHGRRQAREWCAVICTGLLLCTFRVSRADEPPPAGGSGVLVWPQTPDVPTTGATAELRRAGLRPLAFAPVAAELRALARRAAAADRQHLAAVQAGFAAAQQAYLEQRWADMARALAPARGEALVVLGRPEHRATLWELAFQLGLASSGSGQEAGQRDHHALAVAIDEGARPPRELYGPVVAQRFGEVLAATAAVPRQPVVFELAPEDAQLVVDGAPVVDPRRGALLRPGLHVVWAGAPGYQARARLIDTRREATVTLRLAPAREDEILATRWQGGTLGGTGSSLHAALLGVARRRGADSVLLVGRDADGGHVVTRIGAEGGGTGRRPQLAAAVRIALGLAVEALPGGEPAERRGAAPLYTRWWFWAGLGIAVAGGATVAYQLTRPERLVVYGGAR
jgi:hypothetical protein